uniref:DUF1232 domain-containing protein n=1 Tax=Paenibacillus athensensis TaxID=1967502 RepID=A0A4Y8Q9Q0_9BACL
MRKIWSLRYWKHVLTRVWRLLRSPQVPLGAKLLFLIPALLYWVLPDVMPFIPIDDAAVTMLLAVVFSEALERKYPDRSLEAGRKQ